MHDTVAVAAGQITLGTMRLHDHDRSIREWVRFLEAAYEIGIRRMHSSSEYDSFPLLTEVLASLRVANPAIQFRHIVKLACPSFDDPDFSSGNLASRISHYQLSLQSTQISDIQWMWRQDLFDETKRLTSFEESFQEIAESAERLTSQSIIERLLCFPYTTEFAFKALDCSAIDGLVVYRNFDETEFDPAIDACAEMDKTVIIIRPFNGGTVLRNKDVSARKSLGFALNKPAIESAIISSGNLDHIRQLIEA